MSRIFDNAVQNISFKPPVSLAFKFYFKEIEIYSSLLCISVDLIHDQVHNWHGYKVMSNIPSLSGLMYTIESDASSDLFLK